MFDHILSSYCAKVPETKVICDRIDELIEIDSFVDHPGYQTNNGIASDPIFRPIVNSFLSACEQAGYFGSHIDMWAVVQTNERQSAFPINGGWHNHDTEDTIVSSVIYLVNPENVGTDFQNGVTTSGECWIWNLFSPKLYHRPGLLMTDQRRYSIATDLKFGQGCTSISDL